MKGSYQVYLTEEGNDLLSHTPIGQLIWESATILARSLQQDSPLLTINPIPPPGPLWKLPKAVKLEIQIPYHFVLAIALADLETTPGFEIPRKDVSKGDEANH